MTKCKKCGRKIADGEKYCVSCKELRDHKGKSWTKWIVGGVMVVAAVVVGVATKGKVKIDTSKWV